MMERSYATITFIVFFAASASTSIIALLLEAVGYDPTLGSMGQLAGVPEKSKCWERMADDWRSSFICLL